MLGLSRDPVLAAFAPSTFWMPVAFLFPFLSPVVRCLAWLFPDSGMLRMKSAANIIVDIVAATVARRRRAIQAEVLTALRAQSWANKMGVESISTLPRLPLLCDEIILLWTCSCYLAWDALRR